MISRSSFARPGRIADLRASLGWMLLLVLVPPAVAAPGISFLSDLPDETLQAIESNGTVPEGPYGLLEAVIGASEAYRFRPGAVEVYTDPRWFSSLPGSEPGAPFLVLRRWPGDTALAYYALAPRPGQDGEPAEAPPSFQGAQWTRAGTDAAGWVWWEGALESDLGEHPARWAELELPDRPARLGALLLPGDAGLGRAAVASIYLELRYVLGQTRLLPKGWEVTPLVPPGVTLIPPTLSRPPGDADEGRDPWQVVRATEFTLGLPPGVRARRTDAGYQVPRSVPGGRLWFRGRFVDRDETAVVVGDERRSGYVAIRTEDLAEWFRSETAPAGAPGAKQLARIEYEVAAQSAGAEEASAERWRQEGFEGQWLVFRIRFPDRGVEIGIPVLEGRKSEALFWMPVTFRDADRPPAPPPVDAAKRFGIRFEQFQGAFRRENPWSEGYLEVPGLRLELPRGWWPMASLRSRDGFPVQFLDEESGVVGQLLYLGSERPELDGEGWESLGRPGRYRASEVHRRADGSYLFRSRSGFWFRLEPASSESGSREAWQRLADSAEMLALDR